MIGLFSKKEIEVLINKRIDMSLVIKKNSIAIILNSFEKENSTNFWDLKETETYEVIDKLDINVITDIIENKL